MMFKCTLMEEQINNFKIKKSKYFKKSKSKERKRKMEHFKPNAEVPIHI